MFAGIACTDMDSILTIDIGTTGVKILLFDLKGNVIRGETHELKTYTNETGSVEQSPQEIYQAVETGIANITGHSKIRILGVALSGALHSLLGVDTTGDVLFNAMIWSDMRSSEVANELKANQGDEIHFKTGTPIHPMSPLCKLIWLKRSTPDLFEKTYKFLSLKEYVIFKLTGEFVVDTSLASATGLLNTGSLAWEDHALEMASIEKDRLGQLAEPTYSLPIKTGPLKGLRLILGGGDGCLANLGSGVMDDQGIALTIGTSAAIRSTVKQPEMNRDSRTFTYHIDQDWFVKGGASNNGGNVYRWLNVTYPEISDEGIIQSEIGANGLTALPYVFGERAPFWTTGLKEHLHGLTDSHSPNDIARSYLEGLCYNLLLISGTFSDFEHIVASGGFIKSVFWPQMISDIFGKPVHLLQTAENTSLGAALIGMKSLGLISHYQEATEYVRINQVIEPVKSRSVKYDRGFGNFLNLLGEVYPELV